MYLMDIGREITIFILLIYLIYETKEIYLQLLFFIILLLHIYKLINSFNAYYKITKKHKFLFLFMFIILLYSLKLLIYNKNINIFIIVFILFRIIISKIVNYKEIEPLYNNNLNIIYSILLLLLYINYDSYKYKNIFIMSIINHMLLYYNI
jgi:hypothetical protein